MAWPNDQEKTKRQDLAILIGRQEFWKEIYCRAFTACTEDEGGRNNLALSSANKALVDYDSKFGESS